MSQSMPAKPVECIGFILDGNRRWAKARNLPTLEGHRAGFRKLKETSRWVRDKKVPHMVVYAFSTENWNRSKEEVAYLLEIIWEAVSADANELAGENVRLRFAGARERFNPDLREAMMQMERDSAHNTKHTLWICLSYGGRAEIVAAARNASLQGGITEVTLAENLWTAGMPDPDLIVRTGGAMRLSNFLLWQAAYTELFFLEKFWPDFCEKDLDEILQAYAARTRNFGI